MCILIDVKNVLSNSVCTMLVTHQHICWSITSIVMIACQCLVNINILCQQFILKKVDNTPMVH